MSEFMRRGSPGLKSIKDLPVQQDGPPPGGFPSIRYARRIPSTGPTGVTLFAVGAVVMAYGFYKVGQSNHARRNERQEIVSARKALVPFLQAEEDARWVGKYKEFFSSRGMDGELGTGVYKTRWMPPAQPVGAWK
jgi:NADH dehydrogenase (ubiquinone) 1 alpha subcomplex subunit 13